MLLKSITLMTVFLLGPWGAAFAIFGEVLIDGGAEPAFCEQVGRRLTSVVNVLESGDLSGERALFTSDGYDRAVDLLKRVPMENGRPTQKTPLLKLPGGGWEVRDIRVSVVLGETAENRVAAAANPYQYLVFQLTPDGLIDDVRFALESTHYRRLMEEGERLKDFTRRQKILQTLEIFRTAYCRKDLEYLKQVYSDDALIIVGRVLKPREDLPDGLERVGLSRDRIEFIRMSKRQYIEALANVFQRNAFVKVVFDSVEVAVHERDPNLYGVTLKQNWYSSVYSDTGWVFLLWDFQNEENPTIYVRSWQPERFPDGALINLYEFNIIRTN